MTGRPGSFVNREHMLVLSSGGRDILASGVHLRVACQPGRMRLFGFV